MIKPETGILDSQDHEQKLFSLVAAYQAELDAGRQPDKTYYLNCYPENTGYLAEILHVCDIVTTPSPSASTATGGSKSTVKALPSMGDYHLEREIGSGGMGIIYEATQLSLNRKVALKLMRPTLVVNERSKKRFVNEAHAAATLQHPHIVSVYECGIEAATPYYAMQYIEGISVSRLIHLLRHTIQEPQATTACLVKSESSAVIEKILKLIPPLFTPAYFHWIAGLIVQATSALQYAHECGIIHRDIKPGNFLIDAQGKLWITDFGLAHLPDSDMTVTSETLGTPRYMSPEQLNQPRSVVDQRTDLYSLGITLYELLTLQPAFGQETRQQLSQAILQSEPVSPRKLVPTLPVDLQVITCKAIAKEPAERYHSAQQFGEELQRFLEDRPILARPPSLVRRGRHWARRNPLIVGVSLISLGLVLLGCILLLWRENAWNERIVVDQAQAMRKQDKLQSQVRSNLQLALNMLDEYFLSEEENRLLTEGIPQARKKEVIQQGIRLYEQLALSNDETIAHLKRVQTHRRLGYLYSDIGDHDKADAILVKAVEMARQLVRDYPTRQSQFELVECLCSLARAKVHNKQTGLSRHEYQQALEITKELYRLQPADTLCVLTYANILINLSLSYDNETGMLMKKEALSLMEMHNSKISYNAVFRGNLAFTYNEVALSYYSMQMHSEGIPFSRKSLLVFEGIAEEDRSWRMQALYARTHTTLADVLRWITFEKLRQTANKGLLLSITELLLIKAQRLEAQMSYEKALAALYSIQHYKNVVEIQHTIAYNLDCLGWLHFDQKDYDLAIRPWLDAEKAYLKLKMKYPEEGKWGHNASKTQFNLWLCYRKLGMEKQTIASLERAIVNDPREWTYQSLLTWHLAVAQNPELRNGPRAINLSLPIVQQHSDNPHALQRLAAAYIANSEWENAISRLKQCIKIRGKPISTDLFLLARAYHGRGDYHLALATLTQAQKLIDEAEQPGEIDIDRRLLHEEIRKIVNRIPSPGTLKN